MSMAWAFLLHLGIGSCFYIALQHVSTIVRHLWLLWIYHTFYSFLKLGFRIYSCRLQRHRQGRHLPSSRKSSGETSSSQKWHWEPSLTIAGCGPSTLLGHIQTSRPITRGPPWGDLSSPYEEPNKDVQSPSPTEYNVKIASTSRFIHILSPSRQPLLE